MGATVVGRLKDFLNKMTNSSEQERKGNVITLGSKVRDKVSGFTGIAMGRTDWMYGCSRYGVKPQELHDGKTIEMEWFDEPQLEVIEDAEAKPEPKTGGPQKDPSSHREHG